MILACLAVSGGVALRWWQAARDASASAAWEADGFVRAWEPLGWSPWNRVRPPLHGVVLQTLCHALGVTTVQGVRLISVALSLAGLAGALVLARVLSQGRTPQRFSWAWAAACVCALWDLQPTLLAVAPTPTADSLLGGLVCLTMAAAVHAGRCGSFVGWLMFSACAAAALLAGGLVVAAALVAGVLVLLAPMPPLRVAVPVLLAVALAFLAAWRVQRGPDAGRRWLPDTAPAWSLAALTGVVERPFEGQRSQTVGPDLRTADVWEAAWQGVREAGPLSCAAALADRCVADLLAPRRFGEEGLQPFAEGCLDLLLRGGIVLLAVAALRLGRAGTTPWLPRAGLVSALLVFALGCVATATHPFALAPLDLVLLGLAGAGLGTTDPAHMLPRRVALGAGGLLLLALAGTMALHERPPSGTLDALPQPSLGGQRLVSTLADGGPQSGALEHLAAILLMERTAPMLWFPEAGLRHALNAAHAAPLDELVLATLVSARLENLQFEEAAALASTLRDEDGMQTSRGRVLVSLVADSERRYRAERAR